MSMLLLVTGLDCTGWTEQDRIQDRIFEEHITGHKGDRTGLIGQDRILEEQMTEHMVTGLDCIGQDRYLKNR